MRTADPASPCRPNGSGTPVVAGPDIRELMRLQVRLLSNLMHQARSPITAVRGYTRLTLDERVGRLNDVQKDYLTKAETNAQRLLNVINVLTGVLEASEPRGERWGVDLEELLGDAIRAPGERADRLHVRLDTCFEARPHVLLADRSQLLQVFTSLTQVFLALMGEEIRSGAAAGRSIRIETRSRDGSIDVAFVSSVPVLPATLLSRLGQDAPGEREDVATRLAWAHGMTRLHGGELRLVPPEVEGGPGSALVVSLPVVHFDLCGSTGPR